jgi:hypothetical protein
MTTFNWTIDTCEYELTTGGITVAHWRCNAVEEDYNTSAYGSCGFTPDPTSENFKPYNEITEAEVLSWVWASIDKSGVEDSLQDSINTLKAPKVTFGTPR